LYLFGIVAIVKIKHGFEHDAEGVPGTRLEKEDEKAGTQNIPPEEKIMFPRRLPGHHLISHGI
jgi:hypothetical protein